MMKLINLLGVRFFSEKSPILRIGILGICLVNILVMGGIWENWSGDMFFYALISLVVFMGVILNGVYYIEDIYELDAFGAVLSHLLGAMFGGMLPSLRIVNGEKEIQGGRINVLDRIGGPGWLFVEPGNVVVLETLTAPSRILGAGEHKLKRGEIIKDIIRLGEYSEVIDEIISTTQDGIDVKVSGVEYRFCINSHGKDSKQDQDASLRTLKNPYPFSKKSVTDLVYNRSVSVDGKMGSWMNAVQGILKNIISEHIAAQDLDTLLSPPASGEHPMYDLRKKFDLPENREKIKAAGAKLVWVNIGNVAPLSVEIERQRMRVWLARQSGTARILRAQGEAEKISSRERGSAESQAAMLQSIAQALTEMNPNHDHDKAKTARNLWNIVLARTAQVLESMNAPHDSKDGKGAKL